MPEISICVRLPRRTERGRFDWEEMWSLEPATVELDMKTDSEIERDVKAELGWNPDLKSTDIAISVKDGVVTLAGFVPRYIDKYEAEKAAKRVAGVLAVANDIEIRLPAVDERPDPEIAREAVTALKNQLPFSYERIKAVVRNGWVTLEGDVERQYQRQTAERAVRHLKGVKGIINDIKIKPRVEPSDIKQKIQEAFRRSAEVDANQITRSSLLRPRTTGSRLTM